MAYPLRLQFVLLLSVLTGQVVASKKVEPADVAAKDRAEKGAPTIRNSKF